MHLKYCGRACQSAWLLLLLKNKPSRSMLCPQHLFPLLQTKQRTCSCPCSASYSSMYAGRTPARVAKRFSARSSSARRFSSRAASCPSLPDSSTNLPCRVFSASVRPEMVSWMPDSTCKAQEVQWMSLHVQSWGCCSFVEHPPMTHSTNTLPHITHTELPRGCL